MLKICLVLLFCALVTADQHSDYNGYKVYETVPQIKLQADLLNELSSQYDELDFWALSKVPGMPARVLVPPHLQNDFVHLTKLIGLEFDVIDSNVAETLKRERIENESSKLLRDVQFSRFYRHGEINNYLDELAKKFPDIVKVSVAGQSYEGRDLKIIKISNGKENAKKVIFVDAGIHAREWIAPATALYIIHQLVENFQDNQNLLEHYDWVVLPVVNPDGYEYTHVGQRFWRKTRKPNKMCRGTDGNRNFGYHWGEEGASPQECTETYQGPRAFSESETQTVRDILHSLGDRCKMYLTLHSYGRYLLYPWGFTSDLPDNWRDLEEVSDAGANAIREFSGSRYRVGSSTNVLYAAAGGSDDYALGVAKVPIAITMELPPGGSGFDPPPSQILKSVTESWVGIKAMAKKLQEKY